MKKFLLLLTPLSLVAQTIEIKSLYQPAPLAGVWKEQIGDDPQWAAPDFDDSNWVNVEMPRRSTPGRRGITWYRIHIHLTPQLPVEPLAILVGPMFPAYEIFTNGKQIGSFGGPLGDTHGQLYARPADFQLPREAELVVAIRSEDLLRQVGAQSSSANASLSWIGTQNGVTDKAARWLLDRNALSEPLRNAAVILLAGSLLFIALALARRRNFEYLWMGIFLAGNAVLRFLQTAPEWMGNPNRQLGDYLVVLSLAPTTIALLLFCRATFQLRPTWIAWGAMTLSLVINCDRLALDWMRDHLPLFLLWQATLDNFAEAVVYCDFAWRARNQLKEFWLLHLAFGVFLGSNLIYYGMRSLGGFTNAGDTMTPFEVGLRTAILALLFAMSVILSQRSAKSDQEQGRLLQEMAAAGEVQELLLAAPAGGGIDAVYLPASEVGGDFYHVQSYPDGSHVALVGDVSGKGLKAAMVVSVVIGALQSQTATTPEGILSSLNRVLKGRVGGGFATCCCFRIESKGRVTIASAGHPAPYCDGREIEVEAGLPLGLVSEVVYNSREFQLELGEQITLVSDGVLEAENREGELFGFERTREISGKSAQEIANAAKVWGQNDDITVVTVRRAD